jgi:hypothetical protein
MKSKLVLALVTIIAIISGSSVFAGPPPGGWKGQQSLSTIQDFSDLKPGDQIVKVCKMCDAVSTAEIMSEEHAMAFCKEGASMDCPSCENVAKVVRTGPPAKGKQKVKFVDKHGNACMVMAKIDS